MIKLRSKRIILVGFCGVFFALLNYDNPLTMIYGFLCSVILFSFAFVEDKNKRALLLIMTLFGFLTLICVFIALTTQNKVNNVIILILLAIVLITLGIMGLSGILPKKYISN